MSTKLWSISLIFGLLLLISGIYLNNRPKIITKIDQTNRQLQDIRESIAPLPTQIQASGLPNKHLIEAAFIPQAPEKNWDQPWQDACEEASLLTVDYYYKHQNPDVPAIKDALLNMFNYETSQGYRHDVNIDQMAQVANDYLGYRTQLIDKPTSEDIKKYIAQDIPVVVPASGKILYKENKNFQNGGPEYHNIVILGYDDTKNQFIVHDVGTRKGAYFKYSYKLLLESIHDFPESGNKADILTGKKRVIVLLQ